MAAVFVAAVALTPASASALTFARTDYTLAGPASGGTHLIGGATFTEQLNRPLAVADLNGDGRPDLVAADYQANAVYVLLGNGDGTFTAASGSPFTTTCHQPQSVVVVDGSGDAKPDVIVACETGPAIYMLVGDGHGALAAGTSVASGDGPVMRARVDGQDDLLFNSLAHSAICWAPLATLTTSTPTCATGAGSVAVSEWASAVHWFGADCDSGDELLTFADTGATDWSMRVLAGARGCGSFETGSYRDSGIPTVFGGNSNYPTGITAADVENDGIPDVVMSDQTGFHLLTGETSTDGVGTTPTNVASPGAVEALAVADVTGDANLDLLGTNVAPPSTGAQSVAVHAGHGTATQFDAAQSFAVFGNWANYDRLPGMAAADLNADGKPDVVTSGVECDTGGSTCSTALTVLLNTTTSSSGGTTGGTGGTTGGTGGTTGGTGGTGGTTGATGGTTGGGAMPFPGIRIRNATVFVSATRKALLKFVCPSIAQGRCIGTVALRARIEHKGVLVGSARLSILAGRTLHLKLQLSSQGWKLLRHRHRLTTTETVRAHDATSAVKTTSARVKLRLQG